MNRFRNQKKKLSMTIALVLIVFVGLAYAFLNEKLTINSIVSYNSMKWDVGFTSADGGIESVVDMYIEMIEKEAGMTLEEMGVTREELEAEMFSEVVVASSTATISEDKKTLNANCNLESSLETQVCFIKATISNASLLDVAISKTPTISYDDTYIDDVSLVWFDYRLFPILETPTLLAKGHSLDSGESAEVMLGIMTKELTEETLPKNKVSIPITISLDFEETSTPISQLAMVTYQRDDFAFWHEDYQSSIKNITFQDKINIPENAIESWDISLGQNGKVMSYIIPNERDSTYYDLYIQSDTQLYANFDMNCWFAWFENVDSINGLDLLDTSYTNNMNSMFYQTGYNSTVFMLDVSGFDTSNVTDMSSMFSYTGYNSTVFTLDVSGFDTSNVTDMSSMFSNTGYNSTVFTLDVSGFDTSNVTDMSSMFSHTGYNSTEFTLDVSGFDTSNVTDMSSMFSNTGYNSTVFTLDVSNFDTSNVTNMSYMFYYTGYNNPNFTLDVSKFNTSNVTNMSSMFSHTGYNSTVFTLDVSGFDTSKVTEMQEMFYYAGYNSTKLNTSITIRNPNVMYCYSMFWGVATKEGSQITVNYTSETSDLVDKMVQYKSDDSNVVRGDLVN